MFDGPIYLYGLAAMLVMGFSDWLASLARNNVTIGPHYARTLAAWRNAFFRNIDQVRALGYPESFVRMWEFYLCYCEGGFEERALGDVQLLLVKPDNRRPAILPTLAAS